MVSSLPVRGDSWPGGGRAGCRRLPRRLGRRPHRGRRAQLARRLVAELLALPADVVALDIPIGLPDGAARSRVERVVEVHPEVSLRRLCGRPLPPKRTAAGRIQRLEVLRGWLPELDLPVPRPGRAAPDDCLDALACACTATRWLRGEAEVPGDEDDATGLPMRIVV